LKFRKIPSTKHQIPKKFETWNLSIVCPPAKAIALAIAGREFGIWDLGFSK
jgi:hypothetical protein